jgi:hypothetical protein
MCHTMHRGIESALHSSRLVILQQQDRGCLDFFGGGVIFAWFETPTTHLFFHRNVFDFSFLFLLFPSVLLFYYIFI